MERLKYGLLLLSTKYSLSTLDIAANSRPKQMKWRIFNVERAGGYGVTVHFKVTPIGEGEGEKTSQCDIWIGDVSKNQKGTAVFAMTTKSHEPSEVLCLTERLNMGNIDKVEVRYLVFTVNVYMIECDSQRNPSMGKSCKSNSLFPIKINRVSLLHVHVSL